MCVLVNDVVYFIVFSISKNLPDPYIIYTIFNIQFLIFHLCSTSNILDRAGQSKRENFLPPLFKIYLERNYKINNPLPPQYDRMVSRENSRYPTNPSTGKEILPSKFLHQLNESVIRGACSTISRSRWRTSILRATSFRGEQFCVARLSTLFSKLEIACWKVLLQPLLLR